MIDINCIPENDYLLLTPGPLSTSKSVRAAMLKDICTWDKGYNIIVQQIRESLIDLALSSGNNCDRETITNNYTAVLMQGSGTFAVEAVIGTAIPQKGKTLIFTNGAYGKRIVKIAQMLRIDYKEIEFSEPELIAGPKVEEAFRVNPGATHAVVVHCETTTGILNPLDDISSLAKQNGMALIVDAMSSFGGVPIDIEKLKIDFLVSSANKCIQGVPGFGFVIARRTAIENCAGNARSHSLDLYDQWLHMEENAGKWRFTSPTHSVMAFRQALKELKTEGGISARYERYRTNQIALVEGMERIGFSPFISKEFHSPIITTFLSPGSEEFSFQKLYSILKENGYVIYPGKLTGVETFRIGNIGEVYREDIIRLISVIEENRFW